MVGTKLGVVDGTMDGYDEDVGPKLGRKDGLLVGNPDGTHVGKSDGS